LSRSRGLLLIGIQRDPCSGQASILTLFFSRYWNLTSKKAGWWTLLDRIITGLLYGFIGYTWICAAGIDPRAVAVTGGAGGLAIGLAAQAVVGNGVAALIVLATAPCTVGDKVEVGMPDLRYKGVITEIGWNSTGILNESGDKPYKIYVPNGVMLESPLVVYGKSPKDTSHSLAPEKASATKASITNDSTETSTFEE